MSEASNTLGARSALAAQLRSAISAGEYDKGKRMDFWVNGQPVSRIVSRAEAEEMLRAMEDADVPDR